MPDFLISYKPSLLVLGIYGALYLFQLLLADVVGIVRKHNPGTPIEGDHDDLLFRATRAHANSTESVGAVILISAFAILTGGDARWVNGALWAFLVFRIGHMLAYYFDLRAARSACFGLGVVSLLVVFVQGLRAF
jgi:uncharacterized MAPEG superfamily protein